MKCGQSILQILVVDDEPLVCDAVRMLLNFDGHSVDTVGNAREALAVYNPDKYDLVMLDYEMPGMKGDELAVTIKKQAPQQPILLLTAHGDVLRASGKPIPGIDLIVDKPFRLDTLRAGIQTTVGSATVGSNACK